MNPFHEYALLIAVVIPVLALVGLNVFLWAGGERGTLLLPSKHSASSSAPVSDGVGVAPASVVDETPEPTGKQPVRAPANDLGVREAA